MAKMEPLIVKVEAKNLITLIEEVNKLTDMIGPMSKTIKYNKQMIQEQQVVLIGLTKIVRNLEDRFRAKFGTPMDSNPFAAFERFCNEKE